MIRANSLLFAMFSTLSWNTSRKTAPMFWRNPLHLSKFSSFQTTFGMNGYFFQSTCIELNLILISMHINHSSKATAVMCLTTTWPASKIRSKSFNRSRMQLAKQLWLSAFFIKQVKTLWQKQKISKCDIREHILAAAEIRSRTYCNRRWKTKKKLTQARIETKCNYHDISTQ